LDRNRVASRYLFYWFTFLKLAGYVDLICNVATIAHFTAEKVKAAPFALPPLETQKRIAAFLDEKTAQIDGLITKKRALLERLIERRQAIVTQAVTKGLNPTAAMKDSGIDWLGQIPAHWEVKRLSFVSQVIDCKHRTPEYIDDGIPLVSTTEISPYAIDYHTKRQVSDDELAIMSEGGRQPRIGDIIYSRNASVGSAALVRDDRTICMGQDLCLVRPSAIHPEFLEHFLNSTACLVQLGSYLVGATFKRVNVDVIKKYALPLPPSEEQMAIAEQVSVTIANAEAIERKVSDSISALSEYRSAVITSAVTGQMEGLQ
jgi:type I restriction enzyme S subunit